MRYESCQLEILLIKVVLSKQFSLNVGFNTRITLQSSNKIKDIIIFHSILFNKLCWNPLETSDAEQAANIIANL